MYEIKSMYSLHLEIYSFMHTGKIYPIQY